MILGTCLVDIPCLLILQQKRDNSNRFKCNYANNFWRICGQNSANATCGGWALFKSALIGEYSFWQLSQTSVCTIDGFKVQWEKYSYPWYLIEVYDKEDNRGNYELGSFSSEKEMFVNPRLSAEEKQCLVFDCGSYKKITEFN